MSAGHHSPALGVQAIGGNLGMSPNLPRLQQRLQAREVLPIRMSHCGRDERGHPFRKTRRRTCVAQRHARFPRGCGFPCVNRLHGERTVRRAHDESLMREQIHNFVRIAQPASQELGYEGNSRSDSYGWRKVCRGGPLRPPAWRSEDSWPQNVRDSLPMTGTGGRGGPPLQEQRISAWSSNLCENAGRASSQG
jgi:hypothetical protein